jgi:hypothetical protein
LSPYKFYAIHSKFFYHGRKLAGLAELLQPTPQYCIKMQQRSENPNYIKRKINAYAFYFTFINNHHRRYKLQNNIITRKGCRSNQKH